MLLFALRTLLRHRAQLIQHRAPHIQHLQKALLQMNIQLSQALSDVTGQTGQHIIRAIVAGERDPFKLAALRNYRCKKDEAEIAKALTGTWRDEHLFVLQQALEIYDFYTLQIQACDVEIQRTYSIIRPDWPGDLPDDLPTKRNHSHSIILGLAGLTSTAWVYLCGPPSNQVNTGDHDSDERSSTDHHETQDEEITGNGPRCFRFSGERQRIG